MVVTTTGRSGHAHGPGSISIYALGVWESAALHIRAHGSVCGLQQLPVALRARARCRGGCSQQRQCDGQERQR